MKPAIFYALREIRRRPFRFIALVAVAAAIFTILIMMLLYLNAAWRASVLPDNEENYHFYIKNPTDEIRLYIYRQPWVQASYDISYPAPDGGTAYSELRVRVVWADLYRATAHSWEVFDEFDLWNSPDYAQSYQSVYEDKLRSVQREWLGLPVDTRLDTGLTIAETAEELAKHQFLMSSQVKNISFSRLCINTYVIRPEFLALMILFSLYFAAAMMILITEYYKRLMPEFGTLRSLGMKNRYITVINCTINILSSLAAIPLGSLVSLGAVKLYTLLLGSKLDGESEYLTLLDSIPLSVIIIVAALMTLSSFAGCVAICRIYGRRGVMELISQSGEYKVSFVAKTSRRFERARGCMIYSRLHLFRTRVSFLLEVLIIVMLMPLPLYYLAVSAESLTTTTAGSPEFYEGCYFLFQAAVLFITSMTVIYVSARSRTDERHSELGILRSLGLTMRRLRALILPESIVQIILTAVPSVLLFVRISGISDYSFTPKEFLPSLIRFLYETAGVIILITPPLLCGLLLSLRRFTHRSEIENIRDK